MDPPNLSIQAILRENNRERLYVRPILWTRRQLQLLNCAFVEEEVHSEKGDPPSESVMRTWKKHSNPMQDIADLRAADIDNTRFFVGEILSLYGYHSLESDQSYLTIKLWKTNLLSDSNACHFTLGTRRLPVSESMDFSLTPPPPHVLLMSHVVQFVAFG